MKKIFENGEGRNKKRNYFNAGRGFTLIEVIVVVAIIGIIGVSVIPGILSSLETRGLENSARDIFSTIQNAKFQAVKTKLNHRVRFSNDLGYWEYILEREETPSNWTMVPGYIRKSIPSNFNTTVNLPATSLAVEITPLGIVNNYSSTNNTIVVQSDKLKA
ncbi:MAG: prepilin-type N-terminal cleavage/methylation domain-containing protein, partial [Candidatus Aminicenantes bacterium]|nr:prepilin-type N-terminal cleavage/methylation domain-containing protein [Candidatus Aminicenantes bacterium]